MGRVVTKALRRKRRQRSATPAKAADKKAANSGAAIEPVDTASNSGTTFSCAPSGEACENGGGAEPSGGNAHVAIDMEGGGGGGKPRRVVENEKAVGALQQPR